KRTTSKQLAIMGGSNGGLLVGAVEVQRPDLFGACIAIAGVLDVLRDQEFTVGMYSRDDYGHIEKEDEFKALLAYSPYHNIKKGTAIRRHSSRPPTPTTGWPRCTALSTAPRCNAHRVLTHQFCCVSKRGQATVMERHSIR